MRHDGAHKRNAAHKKLSVHGKRVANRGVDVSLHQPPTPESEIAPVISGADPVFIGSLFCFGN